MERKLTGKRPTFRPVQRGPNFYRILLWIGLIIGGIWVLLGFEHGAIESPYEPTRTPTRMAQSYLLEAQAYFDAGKLDAPNNVGTPVAGGVVINDAIDAYKAALEEDPNDAEAWAELARIQAYSSSTMRSDMDRLTRLEEALESVNKAIEIDPEDSTSHAIRAFVLDWYAFNSLIPDDKQQKLLIEAEQEAARAFQFDPENELALAYYAEILADEQKWLQAEKFAAQAVAKNPDSMDTHRVYAYVLESLGQYNSAIQEYQRAAEITPNLTFLYIRIGRNFREGIKNPERALEYFDRAASINEQLGIQNPVPFLEIARTYAQQGEFFIAAINAKKALSFDPTNANTYGQFGLIYRRARNYEGANPLLKCAVKGCSAEENELGGVDVQGLPLTNLSIAYYYVEYGTNLAFLSRPNENYCPEAYQVLEKVRATYPDDAILIGIVNDSESICRRLDGNAEATMTPTPTPTITPTRRPK